MSRARLPDFLLIGAAKAGTTSLFRYLGQHPGIRLPRIKEIDFFAPLFAVDVPADPRFASLRRANELARMRRPRSLAEYAALFADCEEGRVTGEASVSYLTDPTAAEQIAAAVPAVKLIAVLRDPVDRACSHVRQHVRDGHEWDTDLTVILDSALRGRDQAGLLRRAIYLDRGLYGAGIQRFRRWLAEGRLHVASYSDLVREPVRTIRAVFEFLGVDPSFEPDRSTWHNVSSAGRAAVGFWTRTRVPRLIAPWLPPPLRGRVRSVVTRRSAGTVTPFRPELPAELERRLVEYFAADLSLLEEQLGRRVIEPRDP